MNRQSRIAFCVALGVIALAAFGLTGLRTHQRVGRPGLKLIERKVLREDGEVIGTSSVPLPEQVLNFKSNERAIANVVSDWLPRDTIYAQRTYEAPDGFGILVNVVLMGTDRTSIHKPEYCLAGQGFRTEQVVADTVPMQEPHPYLLPVLKMTLRREVTMPKGDKVPQNALYVFWFVADEELTADHNQRMWWMARDLLTRGVLQRWAYVSCFAPFLPGQEELAYARIREWMRAAVPRFQLATGPAATLVRNP